MSQHVVRPSCAGRSSATEPCCRLKPPSGCSAAVDDTEALLLALGLDDRGDGLWEPDASEEASVMSKVLLGLRDQWGSFGGTRGDMATRLQHIVETGGRPARPDVEAWQDHFDVGAHDVEDDPDDELQPLHDEFTERLALPLDRMLLECSCDDEVCHATARITFDGNDRLRFHIEPPGHIVVPSGYLARLLAEQEEEAE